MKNGKLRLMRMSAVAQFDFICSRCGATAPGRSFPFMIEARSLAAAAEQMKQARPRPSEMPEGWASFYSLYGIEFRCQSCAEGTI